MADTDLSPEVPRTRNYDSTFVYGNSRVIQGDVAHISHSYYQTYTLQNDSESRKALYEALTFEGMHSRTEQLALQEIPVKSFDWIWSTSFVDWLLTSAPFFWISGKPGSGKSALMDYLSKSHRVRELLDQNGINHTIIKFFFDFRATSPDTMDFTGLLKALLKQLAGRFPQAENFLADKNVLAPMSDISPNQPQLLDMYCEVAQQLPYKICGFIDGLDEYRGNQWSLVQLLLQMQDRSGMKMVVSSRLEPTFKVHFQDYPTLCMHHHNDTSVRIYIENAIQKGTCRLVDIDTIFDKNLCDKIRSRAQGVILWAKLAVDELLHVASTAQSLAHCREVLEELPLGIEQLYDLTVARIDPTKSSEAALLLTLIAEWGGEIAVTDLLELVQYLEVAAPGHGSAASTADLERFQQRVCNLLASFIDTVKIGSYGEVVEGDESESVELNLRLMHKTVSGYLRNSRTIRAFLPEEFKQKYPDYPRMRIAAEVIDITSKCSGWSSENMQSYDPKWRLRNDLKELQGHGISIDLFRNSVRYMRLDHGIPADNNALMDLINVALRNPVMMFYTAEFFQHDVHSSYNKIDFVSTAGLCEKEDCADIFMAITWDIHSYLRHRLSDNLCVSQDVWQSLLQGMIWRGQWSDRLWPQKESALVLSKVQRISCNTINMLLNPRYVNGGLELETSVLTMLKSIQHLPICCKHDSEMSCRSDLLSLWIEHGKDTEKDKYLLCLCLKDAPRLIDRVDEGHGTPLYAVLECLISLFHPGGLSPRTFMFVWLYTVHRVLRVYDIFILLTKLNADPTIKYRDLTVLERLRQEPEYACGILPSTLQVPPQLEGEAWVMKDVLRLLEFHETHGRWPSEQEPPHKRESTEISKWKVDTSGNIVLGARPGDDVKEGRASMLNIDRRTTPHLLMR